MDLCQRLFEEGQKLISEGRNSECKDFLETCVLNNLNVLAMLYAQHLDKPELSVKCLKLACEIDKGNYSIRNNLAHTLNEMEQFPEAYIESLKSIKISPPDLVGPLINCAVIANNCRKTDEAINHYRRCLEIEDALMTRYNLACCLLYNGNYEEGLKHYEARLGAFDITRNFENRIPHQRWTGEDLKNKTILIYSEQGIGDLFMFSRYIPDVVKMAEKVILECQECTCELMEINFPQINVVGRPNLDMQPPPQADFAISICSLPYLLGYNSIDKISGKTYLKPGNHRVPRSLSKTGKLKVGLCWAGNLDHAHDYLRTCPVKNLVPLKEVDVEYFCLQKDTHPVRLWKKKHAFPHKGMESIPMTDITPFMKNFANTAACLQKMDLIITIDSAIAHLAGAMGVPVWMYIPTISDWRWLKHLPDTSIWYDSMRIYRQSSLYNWSEVIDRIKGDLISFSADNTNLS